MSLYDVLGVSASASPAELRRAFVAAARKHHPDFHVRSSPAERRRSEAEMRRINEAWGVLGDPVARRAYDQGLIDRRRDTESVRQAEQRREGLRRTASGASASFRPFDLGTEGDIDPRLLDDTPFEGATPPPRWMQILPVALVLVGAGVLLLGFLVSLRELVGAGFVVLALGAVAFLLAPLSVMAQGARTRR